MRHYGLSIVTNVEDRTRTDTYELDGVLLETDPRWAGYAPSLPPKALTIEAMRNAIRSIYSQIGQLPNRVVVSAAQLDALNDLLVEDVVRTVVEGE